MTIGNKIISFWKQVRIKSSDMFTLFKVGVGIKVPTHKLHVKDTTDPVKIEGVQSDTSSSTKFLVLDGDDIVKHTTGSGKTTEEVQDIVGAMFTSNTETGVAVTYEDSDGTIDLVVDHDAAANFVAAEHYRWDTDISGTATINTNNITDLHGAGVSGANNQLLTDDGDGTVTSEADLLFDSSAGVLNVGAPGGASTIYIQRGANDDNIGGRLYFGAGDAGGTDKYGGSLHILAGRGTGNAVGGSIFFQSTAAGSSGSSLNSLENIAQLDNVGNFEVLGSITTGSTLFANSSGVIQVANQSNITGVGTISSGTWQGTAIASAYLDSDTMHLSVAQAVSGEKTFTRTIIQDGDRTVTPSDDGIAIHVDSSDITDGNTSASGTAVAYNHITFENPRLFATNASVTTTDASTVFIKGQPIASTNQTITNAWALRVASGPAYFGGTILAASGVTGNVTGNTSGSSGSCTGNAATATALATARAINGVDFDGTAPITITAAGSTLSDTVTVAKGGTGATTASGARSNLGVDAAGTDNSTNVTLAGSLDYITLSGQEITRNAIDLAADVTGTLPVGNGGTGATTLTSNALLTGNGTSAITPEQTLSYDSEILTIGADDNGIASIHRTTHSDEAGGRLEIKSGNATGTNKVGGTLMLSAGAGTGTGTGGSIVFYSHSAGSSGSAQGTANDIATINPSGDLQIDGDLTVDGNNITNNASTANFNIASSRILELQHAGSYDIQLGNSTNPDVLKVEGDAQEVTINGTLELGHATDTTIARSAAGKVSIEGDDIQTQGEKIGQYFQIKIKDLNSYMFYMYNDDSWYSAGSGTLAILGSSTAPASISSANSEYQSRTACYTAVAACTVKKLQLTFYWSSSVASSADIDFAFSKFTPITDGTAASITMNAITATDCNGSYTENKPYQKTFTFSGGNASLSAGDALGFHMRTTGGSSGQRIFIYGTAILSVELD